MVALDKYKEEYECGQDDKSYEANAMVHTKTIFLFILMTTCAQRVNLIPSAIKPNKVCL